MAVFLRGLPKGFHLARILPVLGMSEDQGPVSTALCDRESLPFLFNLGGLFFFNPI